MSFTDYKSFVNFVSDIVRKSDKNNMVRIIENPVKQEITIIVRETRKHWNFSYTDRLETIARKVEMARYEISHLDLKQ